MAEIKHFTLTNSKGESVVLSNFGASILAINVPDRGGRIDNVVLAYAKDEDYYIRNGIGRALSEYARINPTEVRRFVQDNTFAEQTAQEILRLI